MDHVTRAYYEVVFERDFVLKTGDEFQDFFSEIMEKRHPDGDFIRVRPWGNTGDRKNDGYLKSERRLFQCYAPNELKATEAVAKISDDFTGALPYWKEYFDIWVFVHNSRKGIGPDITKKLLDLDRDYEPEVKHWGFEDLKTKTFELKQTDVASLLGPAPGNSNLSGITFSALERVLRVVGRQAVTPPTEVRPVPANKVAANGLSDSVQTLLKAGMSRSMRVAEFFRQNPDPSFGDEVVGVFRAKYLDLDQKISDPDEIFRQLQVFAGGLQRGTPDHEAAVLAVLSYLFEQCDIFKEPLAT